jgi:hypothetical protein
MARITVIEVVCFAAFGDEELVQSFREASPESGNSHIKAVAIRAV